MKNLIIITGGAGINEYNESTISDPEILNLTKKVYIHEDKKYTAKVPEQRSAEVTFVFTNDEMLSKEVIYPKGEPENPILDVELESKYMALASFGGFSKECLEELKKHVWEMSDNLSNIFIALEKCNLKGFK